jgi:putative serine/threonine protein kinase
LPETAEIPLRKLLGTKYSQVLTYPSSEVEEVKSRIDELSQMGISALRFAGFTKIGGIPVLGKGCVGVVIQARLEGKLVALKMRRLDADRPTMFYESRLLRLANSVDVGPPLIAATSNFLAMKSVNGIPLFKWAENMHPSKGRVKGLVEQLLWDCFRLDSIGLDHGELSHAPKNVLVNKSGRPCIVDFESASTGRRVANVTSILQYFMFGRISKSLHTSQIFPNRRRVLEILSEYKNQGSVESFETLLGAVGLR